MEDVCFGHGSTIGVRFFRYGAHDFVCSTVPGSYWDFGKSLEGWGSNDPDSRWFIFDGGA